MATAAAPAAPASTEAAAVASTATEEQAMEAAATSAATSAAMSAAAAAAAPPELQQSDMGERSSREEMRNIFENVLLSVVVFSLFPAPRGQKSARDKTLKITPQTTAFYRETSLLIRQ